MADLIYQLNNKRQLERDLHFCNNELNNLMTKTDDIQKLLQLLRQKKPLHVLLQMRAIGWPDKRDKLIYAQICRLQMQTDAMWYSCQMYIQLQNELQCKLDTCIATITGINMQ